MEFITSIGPFWQILTWFITVGVGVVGYKYFDRWLTKESNNKSHDHDSNRLVIDTLMKQVENLTLRIDTLEKERAAYHLRELEVTKQLVAAQGEVVVLRKEVNNLQKKQTELLEQVKFYKDAHA
jgi:uncharacterized protein YlxW (UPF0749 family)